MSVRWFTTVADIYQNGILENWQVIARIRKLIVAAVSGYGISGTSTLRLGRYGPSRYPPTLTMSSYVQLGDRVRTRADDGHTPRGTQRQVREARDEHQQDHKWRWVAEPRTRHDQVARMELVLTGRRWNTQEAAAWGTVQG